MVHVPVLERQIGPAAGDRPFDARATNTYYPVSEETVPGMLAQLMAGLVPPNTLANMMAFPRLQGLGDGAAYGRYWG